VKIHHLRSATFVIESRDRHIRIDPMLGEDGSLPPFSDLRYKARRHPTVPLPPNASAVLDKITHCLITHSQTFGLRVLQHTDHLDGPGELFLKGRGVPVVCTRQDEAYLKGRDLRVEAALSAWASVELLGGKITAVPARHGQGWIHRLMANGAGFHLQLPGEPSIYISGDTVYTRDVERALTECKPDVAVVAAGGARMDVGGPILMPLEEVVAFVRTAPGRVIANHLESLNHCPVTRSRLKGVLARQGLLSRTFIPEDGETLILEQPLPSG